MLSKKINLKEKYSKFTKHWSPRIIAEMNDYQFKLAKIKGEFVWHDHKHTDETFIVIEGEMTLKFRDGEVKLGPGEIGFINAGIKSVSDCRVGDTITSESNPTTKALAGFKPSQPVVFCGMFTIDSDEYQNLKESMEKLALNDSSFSFEPESSSGL